ncbi:MAG: hypothetical protein ACI8RZ_007981 [Myxococcota bacterium]
MADVQAVYQLIIQGEDAQETMDGLTNSAVDAQGAMGDLSAEAAGVGEGVDGALPAVAGLATGLGSMAKTGRTSTKVMSGLAAAVQGVSPAAANALRGMSGLTRAFTAGGAVLGSYALLLGPVVVAIGALVLVYRELSKAVEEAEAKMAAAAEGATEAAEAHRQFTQALVEVETELKLLNGEIDQYELTRVQRTEQLTAGAETQVVLRERTLQAAQKQAAVEREQLDSILERNEVAIRQGRERVVAGEELTGPMKAALASLEGQQQAVIRANQAVETQSSLLDGVNARLQGAKDTITKIADRQRQTAADTKTEADERERSAAASKAQAEQAKREAEYKAQQAQIDAQILGAGLNPEDLSLELKADPAFLEAIQAFTAALSEPAALRPEGVTGVDPGLARLREELDGLVPPQAITQAEQLGLVQAELSNMLLRGRISAEEYAAAINRTSAARAGAAQAEADAAAEAAKQAQLSAAGGGVDAFGSLASGDVGGIANGLASGFAAAAVPVVALVVKAVNAIAGFGANGRALEAELAAALERGDTKTADAIKEAIDNAGSAAAATVEAKMTEFTTNFREGLLGLPSLLFQAIPRILRDHSVRMIGVLLKLPFITARAIIDSLNPRDIFNHLKSLLSEMWRDAWAEIQAFFKVFDGDGPARRQERQNKRQDRREDRREAIAEFFGIGGGSTGESRDTGSSNASSSRSSAEREAAALLSVLSGRRMPGGAETAAGGPLRRAFASHLQGGGFAAPGGEGGVTINVAAVDPTAIPMLSRTIGKAGRTARYPKNFGG